MAVGVAHAEGVIDRAGPLFGKLRRDFVKPHIVGVNQRGDVAEREEVVARLQAEDGEHGLRPEYSAAREVPIPQAAAAAIERGVDAAAHGLVDAVGFARAGRLPMEGEAEDQDDKAGGGGEGDSEGCERAPAGERVAAQLHAGDLPEWVLEHAHGCQRQRPVGQRDLQNAGAGAERRQRLGMAQNVVQAAADDAGARRRHCGDDAIGIGEHELPAGRGGPWRQCIEQEFLRAARGVTGVGERAVEAGGRSLGERIEDSHHVGEGLAAVIEHLDDRADADRQQEGDDENRDSAAQQRLSGEQTAVGRVGE